MSFVNICPSWQPRESNDCAIIMVAAIADVPYDTAARILRLCGREPNDGTTDRQWLSALDRLGCRLIRVRTIRRTVRTVTRALPVTGRYVVVTTDHVVAYIHGELIDDSKWGDLLRVSAVFKVDFV